MAEHEAELGPELPDLPAFSALADRAVAVATDAGATYADARVLDLASEALRVRNGQVEGVRQSSSAGIGIRVIADGCWGFAATGRLEPQEVERAARLAVEVGRSGRLLRAAPVALAEVEPVQGTWANPVEEDPFAIPLGEKLDLLVAATSALVAVPGVAIGTGALSAWRLRSLLVTSEGTRVGQRLIQCGAGIDATAVGEDEVQDRSFPNSFFVDCGSAG
ncbi:hypothetical protein BH18ACT1_BH18ACT1_15540 [soil metagenome]